MKHLMLWKRKNRKQEAQLDRAGRGLVRAAIASEEELEAAASAPFLYARIRAAVAEKQRADSAARDFSFSMFAVMRRAVPLMVLTTFVSVLLLFTGAFTVGTNIIDETAMQTRATNFDRVVLGEDDLPLSSDEVLSTIIVGGDDDETNGGDQR